MSPRQVRVNVGAMCYDVGMNTHFEDAVQQANREHVAAPQRRSVTDHRAMSEHTAARAHTERTSRYGQEPYDGEH
jgi:hypothetical protein